MVSEGNFRVRLKEQEPPIESPESIEDILASYEEGMGEEEMRDFERAALQRARLLACATREEINAMLPSGTLPPVDAAAWEIALSSPIEAFTRKMSEENAEAFRRGVMSKTALLLQRHAHELTEPHTLRDGTIESRLARACAMRCLNGGFEEEYFSRLQRDH